MADAGGHTQQDRDIVLLGQLEGQLGHIQAFLGVGRLQHGYLGRFGVIAVILLVLRAKHAGFVRGNDDRAAVDAGIGKGEQRVGRHVQTHVLHGANGAAAGNGRADRALQGHFFIGRPFRVDFFHLGEIFQYLRTGRAGIGGGEMNAGLPGAPGDGLIAGEQSLGHKRSPSAADLFISTLPEFETERAGGMVLYNK